MKIDKPITYCVKKGDSPIWGFNSNPFSQRRGESSLSQKEKDKRRKKNKQEKKSRAKNR